MIPFDFQLRTRIVFGPGTIRRIGEIAGEWGVRRAILVSDPGIVAAGHTDPAFDSLSKAGIETHLFHDVHENPTTADVEEGVAFARRHEPELIIGLGGGSSMDCAKGINFVYSNGGEMKDYWGVGKALKPMLPMLAVPTTSGTGSETQSFALISDVDSHAKMACGDRKASFRAAILDPELTRTQPRRITALTGIDAMAHAIESYVTNRRNDISLLYSREAWRLLSANFTKTLAEPDNLDARGGMQLGACLAGLAIENSMLGIAHSLANPLTANFDVVHGQAIATMLPHVIRFNAKSCGDWYSELADVLVTENGHPSGDGVQDLIRFVEECINTAALDRTLSDLGVGANDLSTLGMEASDQWTAQFNPREATVDELQTLYQQAFN